ncbi:MAG: leucine-rich repeat domain-containing protein, partial [Oscillospiraceae bacterium]|nr:leucine-rich repeat domain-containing protein [Oscillospiraceae bacterium]
MKKLTAITVAAAMILGLVQTVTAVGSWTYYGSGDGIVIVSYYDSAKSTEGVVIPDKFGGNPVTVITKPPVDNSFDAPVYNYYFSEITIPDTVRQLEDSFILRRQGLNRIIVPQTSPYYTVDEKDVLFNKDMTNLIWAPPGIEEYVIPDTVKTISDNAFNYCRVLKSITIPEGVE